MKKKKAVNLSSNLELRPAWKELEDYGATNNFINSIIVDHQKQKKIKKEDIHLIDCLGLKYSFQTNQLSYKNKNIDVSPESREIKFFSVLYRNKNETVDYKTIAKEVDVQLYKDLSDNGRLSHKSLKNKDFSEEASFLRRDFRKLAISVGVPSSRFEKMIKTIKKHGYKLLCK